MCERVGLRDQVVVVQWSGSCVWVVLDRSGSLGVLSWCLCARSCSSCGV